MSGGVTRDVGLIGAGRWGRNLVRVLHELNALHTVCDVDAGALAAVPDCDGVAKVGAPGAVLGSPEVRKVAIAAPAAHHYRLAKAALDAGKDVFVEKPIALDVEEAEELAATAKARGAILMVGHLLQYHPCIREARRLVAGGELGRLRYVTSNRLNLGRFRQEENVLWSFAPHDLSVILSLIGDALPTQVRCLGEAVLRPGVPDTTLTTMAFASGVRAHVYVSWLNPFKEQKLTLVGSDGMLVFDDTRAWGEKLMLTRDYVAWVDGSIPTPRPVSVQYVEVPEQEPLRQECEHFLECCAARRRPRTDGDEGVRVLRVLRAAQRSLGLDGRAVAEVGGAAVARRRGVHPTAVVDDGAVIGPGCRIWHFTHVMSGAELGPGCNLGQNVVVGPGVRLGRNVKVQNNVSIYSGTTIEDDVFLGPSCVLTNVSNPRSQVNRRGLYEPTTIRRGATVGANATVVCGTTLGRYCFVAAGAVVTRDVPDYGLAVGSPARRVGWMSRHGHRLTPGADGIMVCPETGHRYRETPPGVVRCLDLDEDAPLPEELATGSTSYRDVSARRTGRE